MAVRSSMADLIARVRSMTQDTGNPSQFTDQDVQDILDNNKTFVRYALLEPKPTLANGGIIAYNDFYAEVGDWESDATLYGPGFAVLTPSVSDLIAGHWQTNLPSPGQPLPVYIVGQFYDRFAAAAELLERWAAAWARNYAFMADGASFQRQQASQMMLTQAAQFRAQAKARTGKQTRDDVSDNQTSFSTLLGDTSVDIW